MLGPKTRKPLLVRLPVAGSGAVHGAAAAVRAILGAAGQDKIHGGRGPRGQTRLRQRLRQQLTVHICVDPMQRTSIHRRGRSLAEGLNERAIVDQKFLSKCPANTAVQ
jgi:hypothetical protein